MADKRQQQLDQVVSPLLQEGERVEYVTPARVGQVRAKSQLALMAISTIVTLGLVTVYLRPKGYYLVLTNQRLMFIGINRGTGKPVPGVAMQLPRDGLTATQPRSRLAITYRVTAPGAAPLKLAFGQPQRRDAKGLAAAIGAAQPTSALPG
jgi:hypothetical protein